MSNHIETHPECEYGASYVEEGVENDHPFRIEHYTRTDSDISDDGKPYTITMHRVMVELKGQVIASFGPSSAGMTCADVMARARRTMKEGAAWCCRWAAECGERRQAEHRAEHEQMQAGLVQPKRAKKAKRTAACAATTNRQRVVRVLPASPTFNPLACPLCAAALCRCQCQLGVRVRAANCPPQIKGWALARSGRVEKVVGAVGIYRVQPSHLPTGRSEWYIVDARGRGVCNCPAYTSTPHKRGGGRVCKHIYAARYQAAASCLHNASVAGDHAGRDGRNPASYSDLAEACWFWAEEYGAEANEQLLAEYVATYNASYATGRAWQAEQISQMRRERAAGW